eukprot:s1293_g3.t1
MNAVALIETTALISILTGYFSPVDHALLDRRLASIETVARLCHAVLTRTGCSLSMQSMYYFWQSSAQAILILELALFPGQRTETTTEIALPSPCQSLSILQREDFNPFVQFIQPSWEGMLQFADYLEEFYSRQDHVHIFQAVEDVIILIEHVATIRGIRLHNDQQPWDAPPAAAPNTAPNAAAAPIPDPVAHDEASAAHTIETELDLAPVLPDSGSTP